MFVQTLHAFYAERAAASGRLGAKSGAVTFEQRTSSDLRLNPHQHVVLLDGAPHDAGAELMWEALGPLKTREVGEVLERAVRRIGKYLRRRGLFATADANAECLAPEDTLAASAVSDRRSRQARSGGEGCRR